MIPESTVHITDKPLSSAISLREGSFVFVRVLGEKSDGTYQVTFAGNRFSVHADKKLFPGDAFPARLTTDGRKLILLPDFSRMTGSAVRGGSFGGLNNSNIYTMSELSESEVAQYFTALGLVPDDLSRRIISFMQLLGVRLDADKASFIRDVAKKFPGHEKEAAEAAVILEEKGLPVTEENISKLMGMIVGCGSADSGFTAGVNAVDDEAPNWIIIPYEYKSCVKGESGGGIGVNGTDSSGSVNGEKDRNGMEKEERESFSGSVCLLKEPDGTVSRLKITARKDWGGKNQKFFLFKIYLNYGVNRTTINECTVKFYVQGKSGIIRRTESKLKEALDGIARTVQVKYEADANFALLSDNDIALVRTEA